MCGPCCIPFPHSSFSCEKCLQINNLVTGRRPPLFLLPRRRSGDGDDVVGKRDGNGDDAHLLKEWKRRRWVGVQRLQNF